MSLDRVIEISASVMCERAEQRYQYNECKRVFTYSKSCEYTRSTIGELNIGHFRSSGPAKIDRQLLSHKVNKIREQYKFNCGELILIF